MWSSSYRTSSFRNSQSGSQSISLSAKASQAKTKCSYVQQALTDIAGGKHADGKTENKLILFRDGTYLELIAFVNDDPEKRKGHWW